MRKWRGYAGAILRIELAKGKVKKQPLNEEMVKKFVGGRGINSKILYDETEPGMDAFSPDNPLIFGTGPLNGTLSPSSGRWTVTSKSPLTGILGDANAGGNFGPELKFAGYDHLVIKGKAKKPVYLFIDDDEVQIRKADHLWGKDTWETDRIIKDEIGDREIQIAYIGPAGENLVRIACVMSNLTRAAGKTGQGAVMGSKNLKAIAIRGTKDISVAHPKNFIRAVKKAREAIMSDELNYNSLRKLGTTVLVNLLNSTGTFGYKNIQDGYMEDADKISGETMLEKYVVRHKACFGCIIGCGRVCVVNEGEYKGVYGEKMEYATLQSFGGCCANSNLASIVYENKLCNKYGLDTIRTGVAIAWAMECYQRGIITTKDTGGIKLDWGDHHVIDDLIEKIARREGFGDLLADGSVIAAKRLGKGLKYALHMKGNPQKGNDMRSRMGGALCFFTSTRGADHLRGMPLIEQYGLYPMETYQELYGISEMGDMSSRVGKAPLVIWNENLCAVADALEICKFPTAWLEIFKGLKFKEFAELFTAATGIKATEKDMMKVGERIYNLERAYNIREGITRKDEENLPFRWTEEPLPSGPYKGAVINPLEFRKMYDEYYTLRGWEVSTGLPTKEKLEELDLKDVVAELEGLNKLPTKIRETKKIVV